MIQTKKKQNVPTKLLLILSLSIFAIELIIMKVLNYLHVHDRFLPSGVAIIDSSILVILVFPILYWLVFKPLLLEINKVREAEENIRILNTGLESKVFERTAELRVLNQDLVEEIDKRRKSELEMIKLYIAVEQSAESVFITDKDGIIEYVNSAFEKLTGYTKKEAIGENSHILNSGKQSKEFYENLWRIIRSGKVFRAEMINKKKNGELYYTDKTITPTIDKEGNIIYFISDDKDLTELREVEDLKKIDKLKKDFISNMSHELRTPLNAIIGFSEVLIDQKFGALNETQKDYLNDVLESGKFLLSLINDILDLSKMEFGKVELVVSSFSLKECLKHSLILVKEKALKHNIELSSEIDEVVGHVWADERKVKQVVFNLLSNAVKFTPDGGKVGIKAKINGSEVEVTVWDTGIGISKEDQFKLFRPFMQLEIPLAKKYEGTGLGLSLAKELVGLHKGKIWVESEGTGKGSSFTFSLPIGVA